MRALIRKDLIACRLFLAIALGMYVLWALCTYHQPLGYFVLNIAAIMVLALMPIVVDDKYRMETLVCFLPPSRSKFVLARYLTALLALIAGLSVHYGLGAILSFGSQQSGFWTLCAPQAVLAFCTLPVAFISLYLPCYFRFGLGRGTFVFAVLIIVLATLMTSPLLANELLAADGGFVITRQMLQHPEQALIGFIDHVATAVGNGRFYASVSIGNVALVTGSVALSIRSFNRRDF